MYITDYRKILSKKYKQQNKIKELIYDHDGSVVHLGTLSPGCQGCLNPTNHFSTASFSDLDELKRTYPYVLKKEKEINQHIHKRIYTSNMPIDEKILDMFKCYDIDEIRFSLSAFNFENIIFKQISQAKEYGFRITVEEPAWFLNKNLLLASLPTLQEIGIDHLNIDEIEVSQDNIDFLNRAFPGGRIYKNLNYYLYDENLVYDIMKFSLRYKHTYSILDCNSDLCKHTRFYSKNESINSIY